MSNTAHLTLTRIESTIPMEPKITTLSLKGCVIPVQRGGSVYLAGPITNIKRTEANGWREAILKELAYVGIPAYNPYSAWNPVTNGYGPSEITPIGTELVDSIIQPVNDLALLLSRVMVVCYMALGGRPVVSCGTDHEIALAQEYRKPVIILADRLRFTGQPAKAQMDTFRDWVGERWPEGGNALAPYIFYSMEQVIRKTRELLCQS